MIYKGYKRVDIQGLQESWYARVTRELVCKGYKRVGIGLQGLQEDWYTRDKTELICKDYMVDRPIQGLIYKVYKRVGIQGLQEG